MASIGGFIVARAKNFKKKLVLPVKWIFDLQTSKLVNYSINTNQPFLCYYSSKVEHYNEDGVPDAEPTFGEKTEGGINIELPWEGCFDVYLLKHYSK